MGAVGGQRVLNNDRLQVRMFPARSSTSRFAALHCIALHCVRSRFVSAVFFQDGFGGQRKNLAVIGVDHRRREHLVVVCLRSVTVVLDATVLALDLRRMMQGKDFKEERTFKRLDCATPDWKRGKYCKSRHQPVE